MNQYAIVIFIFSLRKNGGSCFEKNPFMSYVKIG